MRGAQISGRLTSLTPRASAPAHRRCNFPPESCAVLPSILPLLSAVCAAPLLLTPPRDPSGVCASLSDHFAARRKAMSPTPTTFHSRSLLKTIQMIMPAADARGRVDSRDASSLLRPLSNCPNRAAVLTGTNGGTQNFRVEIGISARISASPRDSRVSVPGRKTSSSPWRRK